MQWPGPNACCSVAEQSCGLHTPGTHLLLGLGGRLLLLAGLLGVAGGGQQVGGGQELGEELGGLLAPGAKVEHRPAVHDGHLVALGQELDLVGHQDGGLLAEQAPDAVLKDVLRGVVVDGRQGVVQQDQVAAAVGSARQVEALALATGQVDAAQAGLQGWGGGGWRGGGSARVGVGPTDQAEGNPPVPPAPPNPPWSGRRWPGSAGRARGRRRG